MPEAVRRPMDASSPTPLPLVVRDEGHGEPLVLLHGMGGDHTVWNAVVPLLRSRFRLLLPDLRGHGESRAPPGSRFGFAEHEADLLALLETRGLDSAHLVGLSAGALLALRTGLDRPGRVRSLTLVGGAVYTDGHTRGIAERWAETYQAEGPDALALRFLKDLYYPDWIEAHLEIADQLREELPHRDFRPAVMWAKEAGQFDERARVSTLRPPVLIIQAMNDEVVDASHGRILRQSIADSRIRILAETGHMVPIERPAETAEAIETFVDEVERRRRASPAAPLSHGEP
jgi:3-oxoadipate enol-lactonase